jgi:hypothetical protein
MAPVSRCALETHQGEKDGGWWGGRMVRKEHADDESVQAKCATLGQRQVKYA